MSNCPVAFYLYMWIMRLMDTDFDANDAKYREAFEASMQELNTLLSEREELESMRKLLDQRIEKLRQVAVGLGGICGESIDAIGGKWPELIPDKGPEISGLTDAIREVLSTHSEHYLSPIHIRDLLKEMGFDTGKYKNVLASIHTVLKRLRSHKEVVDASNEGKVVYKWNKR